MHEATHSSGIDPLQLVTRRVFRWAHLLEAHQHDGIRMTVSEMMALAELAEADQLSQSELGDRLGLEKSTVSRLAQGLAARGWVDRQRDQGNRRYTRLRLTPDGSAVATQVKARFQQLHERLLSALTDQERTALFVGLHGVARVVSEQQDASSADG